MSTLNLFPARVPTGWFRGSDGKNVDVFATPEFFRALSAVFDRIGGTNGIANDELALFTILAPVASIAAPDIANLDVQGAEQSAQLHGLAAALEEVRLLAASVSSLSAEVQALRQAAISAEMNPGYQDQFRVNWERPGKIGSLAANTGAFTTLTASAAVALSPANANVVLSPTGTGVVTIAPATAGAIDNVSIGATTASTVKGTTVTATGAFGCNGKAAQTEFASGGALAAYGAGANGLDTGANMSALHAMVVAIRAALVADGIMS